MGNRQRLMGQEDASEQLCFQFESFCKKIVDTDRLFTWALDRTAGDILTVVDWVSYMTAVGWAHTCCPKNNSIYNILRKV